MSKKILLTGKNGQLGRTLLATCPADVEVMAPGREDLDIRDPDSLRRIVVRLKPDVIINTAAYTKVDQAEAEPDAAFGINHIGVQNIMAAARESGARVIHVSTDFVFDGRSSTPYLPDSPVNPLSIYGESKALGERVLLEAYAERSIIIRTSWLYSVHGHNFVKSILRLCARQNVLKVVADQIGTPTSVRGLAAIIWDCASRDQISGVFHWSDSGTASWYDFACAILEEGMSTGLLGKAVTINPVRTSDYPTAAIRPAYSVLEKTATWTLLGYHGEHWRHELRRMLREYRSAFIGENPP